MTAHEGADMAADRIEEGPRLIGEDDYSGAEAAFREAASLEPGDYHVHGNLGFTLVKLRRYAEAEAAYQTAIRLNPADPWPLAVSLDPGNADAQQDLAEMERDIDALEEARYHRLTPFERWERPGGTCRLTDAPPVCRKS